MIYNSLPAYILVVNHAEERFHSLGQFCAKVEGRLHEYFYLTPGGLLDTIDILKHRLVPKHEILSEREKEELLAKYGIGLRHLPRIYSTDPVIKAIGAKMGDIIMITREDSRIGKMPYHRVVVKG